MRPQDLLIVTRRFWPQSGLTELALAELACNLADAGHNVTVATIQWSKDWSEEISFRDVSIVRFSRPVNGPWSSFRYARSLSKYFLAKNYDGIIVSGIGDEANAVIRSAGELTPVILHVDEGLDGVSGKIHQKHVETCLAADAVVCVNPAVANQLHCIDRMPKITVVEPGVRPIKNEFLFGWFEARPARSATNETQSSYQQEIRAALAKAHPILRVDKDQPLVVTASRLERSCDLGPLINAWPFVLQKYPGAKLWLLGHGKQTGKIWQSIVERELSYSVILPGYFDELHDIFSAADLYVESGNADQLGDGLIRAMKSGLCSIAVENAWTTEVIESGSNGILVPLADHKKMAESILYALSKQSWRIRAGDQSKSHLADRFSAENQAGQYVELLSNLSGQIFETAK